MSKRQLIFINAALCFVLVIIVIMLRNIVNPPLQEKLEENQAMSVVPSKPPADPKAKMPPIYDIDSVKRAGQPAAPQKEPKSTEEIFAENTKDDVGSSLAEGWESVKPEDKVKFYEELDNQIIRSKEALSRDPNDRDAQGKIFIAESLKKLADKGFNLTRSDFPQDLKKEISKNKK